MRQSLGLVFFVAGLAKLWMEPARLAFLLGQYRLLPYLLLQVLAVVAPWLELLVGVSLLSGFLRRGAAWLACLLSLGFVVMVASALLRGLRIDCGCLGPAQGLVSPWHLGVNLALFMLSLKVCVDSWEKSG